MFQQSIQRNYTTGFPGDIVRDGPMRGKVARIESATVGTDPGASTNRITRAFGWSGEAGVVGANVPGGSTYAAEAPRVIVGGPLFFGILGHTKHYALSGTADGSLTAALELPVGSEGEFFDMVTGMVVELFNETGATKAIAFGDRLAYVSSAITEAQNLLELPYGALISLPSGAAVPAGFVLIPNARVMTVQSLTASAEGALVVGNAIVQLTQ